MEMDETAPSVTATAALAQTDAKPELAAKAAQPAAAAGPSANAKVPAATAAKKAPAAMKAQKAAEAESKADSDEDMDDEEAEDEAEDEEYGEEGEDVDAAGASSSGKARLSHPKVSKGKPVGTTAAKIAYNKYDVEAAATWKAGEPVPYLFLARVFGRIEAEPKRLLITELMANAFRTVIATSPDDLLPLMSLATNKLAPAYEGIELGIGDSIMIKAVSETCGRSVAAIKADMEEVGDLGEVAMASRTKQVTLSKPKPLQVRGVYKTLKEIALTSGQGRQDQADARRRAGEGGTVHRPLAPGQDANWPGRADGARLARARLRADCVARA
jgi:DNA ligase-1